MAGQDRAWGFRTRAVHAGGQPDPATGARAVPDLPDDELRVRGRRRRRRPVRPAEVRQHLLAHRQPDRRRLRGARRQPRRRHRRRRHRERPGGRAARRRRAVRRGRPHRVVGPAVRRHAHAARVVARAASASTTTFVAVRRRRPTTPPPSARRHRLVHSEVVANPSGAVADIEGLAAVAHDAETPARASTRTVATPYLCRPLEWGADIVVHSATKFLGGHGNSLGGVVVESGRFDWGNGRFPVMTEPVAVVRRADVVGQLRRVRLLHAAARRAAARLRPDAVAVQRLPAAARAWRRCPSGWTPTSPTPAPSPSSWPAHPAVSWVRWAGLPDHPDHERAPPLPAARVRVPCSRSACAAGATPGGA